MAEVEGVALKVARAKVRAVEAITKLIRSWIGKLYFPYLGN